jgi:hypothetical protein
MTGFDHWLDTFIEEKGIEDHLFEVVGPLGLNLIPLSCVTEFCKTADDDVQAKMKETLVLMDFTNDNVLVFFSVVAEAMAI